MKKIVLFLIVIGFLACSDKKPVSMITLENPLSIERDDEAFILTRDQLHVPDKRLLPIVMDNDGHLIPCQFDDLDQDGSWDELAFVYSLSGNELVNLKVQWIDKEDYPVFGRRTNVRYGKMTSPGKIEELLTDMHGKYNLPRGEGYPHQMDGVAWENDKMGFRHYFDGRNCRDVYGKRVSDMVLDTVGIRSDGTPGDTYHVLREWGRDIMSAANSFGLGGLALQTPDSLIRLGVLIEDTVGNVDSSRYTLVVEGPVRSIFKLDFEGWDIGTEKIDVHETVTIWAGKYGYENKVQTSALPKHSYLVTGIVANNNDEEQLEKKYDRKLTSMITHDKQTYKKEYYMGMALIIPESNLVQTFNTPEEGPGILKTWCAKLRPDVGNEYDFNVYAAWELGDQRFSERDFFVQLIDSYAERINYPVKVTLQ